MENYIITKKDKQIHIYFEVDGSGVYSNGSIDWMCSIDRKKDKFIWNDHFVPTIDDMIFVLLIFNNFDNNYKSAKKDDFKADF